MYETFINYMKAIDHAVNTNIPRIIMRAEILPREAEEAQHDAAGELEKLDFIKQPQALLAIAFNIKELSGIPIIMKATLEELK